MLLMAALAANVHRHIFHNAQYPDIHLAKHLHPLDGIQQGNILGRGDHNRTGDGNFLGQRQLDIASARGQIHQQIIQLMPAGLLHHLHQRATGFRPPPDHRGLLGGQVPHGHGLQPIGLHRHEVLAFKNLWTSAVRQAQHQRLAGAKHIRIQQPHPGALRLQRQRQIHRRRGFPHPAFTGSDSNHIGDLVQRRQAALGPMRNDLRRQGQRQLAAFQHRLQILPNLRYPLLTDTVNRKSQNDSGVDGAVIHRQ